MGEVVAPLRGYLLPHYLCDVIPPATESVSVIYKYSQWREFPVACVVEQLLKNVD